MTPDKLRHEAIAWFDMSLSGEMTAIDRDAFHAWLGSSPAARRAYEQLERRWGVAGSMRDDDEIAASREEDWQRYAGQPRSARLSWRALAAAAAVLLAIPSGWLTYAHLFPSLYLESFSTGPSRHLTTTLSDGTVVTLDANTQVRVLEMGDRRRVELAEGHAFFHVAKDPAHPFLVTAIDKTVHALGTAFDVRIVGDTVAVTLVEGRVRVDQPKSLLHAAVATDLVPGRQLFATADRRWTMSRVDVAQATDWTSDQIVYLPDSLGRIIADVNAMSTQKLVLRGNYDPDRRVIGIFQKGDVKAIAEALEMNKIAHVVAEDDNQIQMQAD